MSLNLCRATILTFVRQSLMFCFATSSMLTNEKSVLKHNSGDIGANPASKLAFPNMVKRLISFFNDVSSSHLYNSYVSSTSLMHPKLQRVFVCGWLWRYKNP
eukprot:scaffold8806_cov71-Cylindrotheca_fusiformis.AAC.1